MKKHYYFIVMIIQVMCCMVSCNTSKTFYGETSTNLKQPKTYRLDLSSFKDEIDLKEFNQLKVLNLSNKNIEVIDRAILSIPFPEKLEVLILNNSELSKLPKSISKLTGLKQLSLQKNPNLNYTSVFYELSNLSLEFLDLQFNYLKHLSAEVSNLKTLEELNLSNNQLSNFKGFEILKSLPKLRSLWLRNNEIQLLDTSVNEMTELVNLYLENNQLTSLPKSLVGLKSLRVLHLSYNQFTILPEELQTIPLLILLHIDHCKIEKIPSSFNLETTSIRGLVMNANKLNKEQLAFWKKEFRSFFLLVF